MGIHQAEDFRAVGIQLVGEADFLGEMVEHQQGAIELDLLDLDLGNRGREQGFAVGFATDITQVALHDLSLHPFIFDFREINAAFTFDPANETHSVHDIHHDERDCQVLLRLPQ